MAKTTRLKVKTPLKKKGVTKAEKKKPPKSKDNGALSRLTSLEDESGGVKLSLYGVSGTGKTRFIATWPKPILVIDCNCGVKSIRDIKNIDRIVPIDPEDLSELCEVQARENRWKTIVLDHASSFQDLVLGKVLGLEETPVQLGWGTATQQQWGTVAAGTIGIPRPWRNPAISSSLIPGGRGAVAAYGSTLSPPRQMAMGIGSPARFQLRQCAAPS